MNKNRSSGKLINEEILLLPTPSKLEIGGGFFKLSPIPTISLPSNLFSPIDKSIRLEIGKFTRTSAGGKAEISFFGADNAPEDLRAFAMNAEGYGLVVDAEGVKIWSSQPAGRLYAVMTLRQLRRQFGQDIPHLRIGDAPRLAHRGAMLSFPQGHTAYRPEYMRHIVPQLARWKINALYLYLESYFDFPSLPHTAGPGAMTKKDARELDQLCLHYNIALIPQLNLMAHSGEILTLQKYHHLVECRQGEDPRTDPGFNLCATSPEVQRFVDKVLGDIFDAFSSKIIHVGGDEVSALGECPHCMANSKGLDKLGLYLKYFERIKKIAMKRGRKIGIWGDMLLHYARPLPEPERKKMFSGLRDGTIIYDWHYGGGSPETLKFFVEDGWETIACASTALCGLTSVWPYQLVNQRDLFADAINTGILGGMTTAWCNFTGLHEEQFNYLFATGGTALWSGPSGKNLADGLGIPRFEKGYCLQRYGLRGTTLTRFWHCIGDANGPVLSPLAPFNGANLRKCLYHTDNVLTFWKHYAQILKGENVKKYRNGVKEARKLWSNMKKESRNCSDPYLKLQEGPLLTHEHLLKRFEMTEELYAIYDKAAKIQFEDKKKFAGLIAKASSVLLGHLKDFPPIEKYLVDARREFGLDKSSILRIQATKKKIKELAAFLMHFSGSQRPLPAFIQLHNMFLSVSRTDWYGDREHEWAEGPARFQRYTLQGAAPWTPNPEAIKEPGPWVSVQNFEISSFIPSEEPVDKLPYPPDKSSLNLAKRVFDNRFAMVHFELFSTEQQGLAYYVCRFKCSGPMALEIGLGYDGPVRLWVDQKTLFTDPAGTNPCWSEKAKIPFKAEKGVHEIVIAFGSNRGKAYGIILQLKRSDVDMQTFVDKPEAYPLPEIVLG